MKNKKTYDGVLAEVWEPGKVAKVIVKATEEEIKKLITQINKEVQIIIQE